MPKTTVGIVGKRHVWAGEGSQHSFQGLFGFVKRDILPTCEAIHPSLGQRVGGGFISWLSLLVLAMIFKKIIAPEETNVIRFRFDEMSG